MKTRNHITKPVVADSFHPIPPDEPIKADSRHPMPDGIGVGRPAKYPWATMKVGDSFLFPTNLKSQSCYNIAKYGGLRNGVKFSVRKTDEGYRCWRIA
jgi:hypothetical protein